MSAQIQAPYFIDGLYGKVIEGGIGYFFPTATFQSLPSEAGSNQELIRGADGRSVTMNWLGARYLLTRDHPFSGSEMRLLQSIGLFCMHATG